MNCEQAANLISAQLDREIQLVTPVLKLRIRLDQRHSDR